MPEYLIKDAAGLLGVSDDTLRRWAEAGRIEMTAGESGWLTVDGVALAKLARELAEDADHGKDRVVRDTVMAQVEVEAGPYRFVSLLSREAADELGLEPGMPVVAAVKATNVSVEIPQTR